MISKRVLNKKINIRRLTSAMDRGIETRRECKNCKMKYQRVEQRKYCSQNDLTIFLYAKSSETKESGRRQHIFISKKNIYHRRIVN